MSKKPDNSIELSETLSLCEFKSGGNKGFWLYDKTRGMNLSMRAKSETDAFVEALHYYQNRLIKVERGYASLRIEVDQFVSKFAQDDNED